MRLEKGVLASALILSSTAIATWLSGENAQVSIAASAIIAILTAIDVVIGFGSKARDYRELACRFIDLESKMVSAVRPTKTQLTEWHQKRLSIEKDEPPILHALNTIMHNEVAIAQGRKDRVYAIPWYVRMTCQFISWDPDKFEFKQPKRVSSEESPAPASA